LFERPNELEPTPPPLPSGPAWERLLFEAPLPLVILLIAAGVLTLFIMNRRGKVAIGLAAGAALLLAAAGLWALAAAITTDREEVKTAAADLVDAAAAADTARLDRLLDDTAMAYTIESPDGMGKPAILSTVRRRLGEEYKVEEYRVQESQAVLDGPGVARAQLKVYVVEAQHKASISMWWALDLRRDATGAWRTTAIRPLHPWIAAR
jgi:hypothetical protein